MGWDGLGGLFEDLEQQAEGLHLADPDAEVAERSQSEYSNVTLESRLHASLDLTVEIAVVGLGALRGTLRRVGPDWLVLHSAHPDREWVVRSAMATAVRGLSPKSVSAATQPAVTRLSLRSVLRGLADEGVQIRVHHPDGSCLDGRLVRVGADFVEVTSPESLGRGPGSPAAVVPLHQVCAVSRIGG
jgi:hypothetical protein